MPVNDEPEAPAFPAATKPSAAAREPEAAATIPPAPAEPSARVVAPSAPAAAKPTSPTTPSQQASAATPRTPADYLVGQKATTSLALYLELKARAETAVLRTAGQAGGARSLTALINEAVAREVIRLENEFNDGQPFEPNQGAFRMGRPFGS
jgi:hypothetical protein